MGRHVGVFAYVYDIKLLLMDGRGKSDTDKYKKIMNVLQNINGFIFYDKQYGVRATSHRSCKLRQRRLNIYVRSNCNTTVALLHLHPYKTAVFHVFYDTDCDTGLNVVN